MNNFLNIFRNSLDAIISTDIDGVITMFNAAAEKLTGYSKHEAIGMHIKELYVSPQEFDKVVTSIELNNSFKGEIQNKTKNNNIITCYLSASILTSETGEPIGTMGVSRNISELNNQKIAYEKLLSNVPDIIYRSTFGGIFKYVSSSVKNVLGYDPEELKGTSFLDLIHELDKKATKEHYQNHFQEKLKSSYLEFRVITKSGEIKWVGQKVTTEFSEFNLNEIVGYYGVVRDISEQKATSEALLRSEEKYRELFENSSDLIHSIDSKGKFLYVNDLWKTTLGYNDDEISNMNLFDILHPESVDHCNNLFLNIQNTGECTENRIIYSLLDKNGNKIIVEGSITIRVDSENTVSIQSFLRDVTQQKLAEKKLAERERTLSQIMETINDVFYLYDIKQKRYTYISPNCELILGCTRDFLLEGNNYIERFVHFKDIPKLNEYRNKLFSGQSFDTDYQISFNQTKKWINEKCFPIFDSSNKLIAFSGICRDITDIKYANKVIYEQNIEINSSMTYAKRLQESTLPSSSEFYEILNDAFVFYQPKDVISGDFYVVENIKSNNGDIYPSFFVGDCTGHGIPGALLSLMCNVLLRESFKKQEINTPGQALDFVKEKLSNFFNSNEKDSIRDGMDAAFCVINKKTNQLYFSGANNPCIIVRSGEILEIKGDKQSVGFSETSVPFSNQVIDLCKDDMIFIFSDGYFDQFGGIREKKYTKRRFLEFVIKNGSLSMPKLGIELEKEFYDWKKDFEQIDDVCVIGVRV